MAAFGESCRQGGHALIGAQDPKESAADGDRRGKKQPMAEAAEKRLAGKGWLPELLRTGPVTKRETDQAA
jgi:hypothetical protein